MARPLAADEELIPLGGSTPPPAPRPRGRVRLLDAAEELVPLEQPIAEAPPEHREPSFGELVFGREDVDDPVVGVLPSLGETLFGQADLGEVATRFFPNVAESIGSMTTEAAAGAQLASEEEGIEIWRRQLRPPHAGGLPSGPYRDRVVAALRAAEEKAGELGTLGAEARAGSARAVPADAGVLEAGLQRGITTASVAVPAALATGGVGSVVALGGMTGAQRYGELREQDVDPAAAGRSAVLMGSLEGLTEYLPGATLLKRSPGFAGFKGKLAEFFASELPGENVNTIAAMVDDYANGLREDITGEDLANAIAQTTLDTVLGGGVQVGSVQALQAVAERANQAAIDREANAAPSLEQLVAGAETPPGAPPGPPALPAPAIEVTSEGAAGTRAELEAAAAEQLRLGDELGLTPDVAANLGRLEGRRAEAAARPAPALPAPDSTVYVDSGGQAGTAAQFEDYTRGANEALRRASAEQEALGMTADVAYAGAQREQGLGDELLGRPPADVPAARGRRGGPQIPLRSRGPDAPADALEDPDAPRTYSTPTATEADLAGTRAELDEFMGTGGAVQTSAGLGDAVMPRTVRPLTEADGPVVPGPRIKRSTKIADERVDTVLEYIAKKGGINTKEAIAQGIDPASIRTAAGSGIRRPFRQGGMSFDQAAELLDEAGYDVKNADGRYDANRVLDLLDRSIRGEKIYSLRNQTAVDEQAAARGASQDAALEAKATSDRRLEGRTEAERRQDLPGRRRVASMSTEELQRELLTSPLTGLPNKRAYEERGRQQVQASLDVDSLKWVNDNMGHESGDKLLEAVGHAIAAATPHGYHFSGDEFVIEGATPAEIDDIMEAVGERLAQATIEITKADGTIVTLEGVGVSYGLGDTLAQADEHLGREKQAREAQGARAARGEQPAGATVRRGGEAGRPNLQGNAAQDLDAGEDTDDLVREPGPGEEDPTDEVEQVTLTGEGYLSTTTRTRGITLPSKLKGEEDADAGDRVEEQLTLFTKDDARPGAVKSELDLANELLAELDAAAGKDGDVKTLAVAFNESFQRDHTASLVGANIKNARDLATLAQVFRDPRYETLRYFAIDDTGKTVGQTGVSSRLPAAGAAFPKGRDLEFVRDFLRRTKATGLRMVHNHPSGKSTPSASDLALSQKLAKDLGLNIVHVVINSNEYSVIRAMKDGAITSDPNLKLDPSDPADKILTPSRPHAVLGRKVGRPSEFVALAKELQREDGYLVVVGITGGMQKVRSLGEALRNILNDRARARAQLQRFALQNGNAALFVAGVPDSWLDTTTPQGATIKWLMHEGVVLDVASVSGISADSKMNIWRARGNLGLPEYEIAREVGTDEAPPPSGDYKDLLGEDTRTKQELTDRARAKDQKRSPNKEISPDTGDPQDIFTTRRQADIDDARESDDEDAFVAKHKTGHIPSNAYDRHNADLSWIGTKGKFGKLLKTVELGGKTYELRKTGEINKYTKVDDAGEIVRGSDGRAVMMTAEEIAKKGYAKEEQTIAVFDGDKAIAFAANEFGAVGVFVQTDYQRRGIGSELLAAFRAENPRMQLGQMTPQGENLVRSAYRRGLIREKGPKYGVREEAHHGSPHKFDEFTLEAIGTGEGAAAYGWGLYFAQNRDVAEQYGERLSDVEIVTLKIGNIPVYTKKQPFDYGPEQSKRILGANASPADLEALAVLQEKLFIYEWEVKQVFRDHPKDPQQHARHVGALIDRAVDELDEDSKSRPFIEKIAKGVHSGKIKIDVKLEQNKYVYTVDVADDAIETMLRWDEPVGEQKHILKIVRELLGLTEETIDYWREEIHEDYAKHGLGNYSRATIDARIDEYVEHGGYGPLGQRVIDELREIGPKTAAEFMKVVDRKGVGGIDAQSDTGAQLYKLLDGGTGDPKVASMRLLKAGVRGIVYYDSGSRDAKKGTSNYVVFDARDVRIKSVNGEPVSRRDSDRIVANTAEDMERDDDLVREERDYYVDSPANAQTETPAFKRWFGKSKVVDVNGEPRVMYHSTDARTDFESFKRTGKDVGMHFGTQGQANQLYKMRNIGKRRARSGPERTIPVYLSIKNPLRLDDLGNWRGHELADAVLAALPEEDGNDIPSADLQTPADVRRELMARGYDGIVYKNLYEVAGVEQESAAVDAAYANLQKVGKATGWISDDTERAREQWRQAQEAANAANQERAEDSYIAFEPTQIKSAIGNQGTFDPRFSSIVREPFSDDPVIVLKNAEGEIQPWGPFKTEAQAREFIRTQVGDLTLRVAKATEREFYHAKIEAAGGNVVRESTDRRDTQRRTSTRAREGRRATDLGPSQKGDRGYKAVAQRAIDFWNEKIGWRYGALGKLPGQRAYLEERYKALGNVARAQEIGRGVYDSLKQASTEDKQAVYDYLTTRDGDSSTIADHGIRAIAVKTKRAIDVVGKRLVEVGLLSQEAYEQHAGEYLPRLYLKHVLGEDVGAAIGSGKKLSDLGYLKQRQDIPEEVRKVLLGEITDPAFLASFGLTRTLRDLALVDFLEVIARDRKWTPTGATVEWRGREVSPFWLAEEARQLRRRARLYKPPEQAKARELAEAMEELVDDATKQLGSPSSREYEQVPNSARYGALRGLWVRKEIYDDLVGAQQFIPRGASVAESLLGQGGVITRATQWWKMSKVVLNPPTQVRNFLSNMVLLHLSGVPMRRVYSGEIIGRAVHSIAKRDRYYEIAKKYGLFATTFANQEGARIRDEWIMAQDIKGGGLAKARAFAGRLVNTASDVYGTMEAIGKIAKLIDAMEREGKGAGDAMIEAHESLFDYSLVPRSVQYLRNAPLGAPFVTFMYKALGQLARTAVKHPMRFAPYAAVPYLLQELIKNAYDVDDDDIEKLKEAFPAWMRERGHMLLLPWKDELGRWQVADMGYLVPWGAYADLAAATSEGKGGKQLLNLALLSGPLSDVTAAIETNVDPFTGDPVIRETDPPADKLQQLMGYVWDLAMPGFMTSRGAINQYVQAKRGNVNRRGEPGQTEGQAAMRLFGINVYPVDPEATKAANMRALRYQQEEMRARATELVRNRNLTEAEREQVRETWRKLLEANAKRISEYEASAEIHPNLRTRDDGDPDATP